MANDRPMGFAERLRSIRERKGLSSYALAKLAGLTKQSLSQLERGESQPSWQTVQLLASALGVDFAAFADPNVKPPAPTEPRPRGRPPQAKADDAGEGLPEAKARRRPKKVK